MPQIPLNVSASLAVHVESIDLVDCEWKNCRKNHSTKPNYPNDGVVGYNNSYAEDWVNAGLEPWVRYKNGKDAKGTAKEYKKESSRFADKASSLKYPQYHTHKHHLIPVKSIDKFNTLKHNAKLIGYDINHPNNGACLPTYQIDIVQHDLQRHRGSHPKKYKKAVAKLLRSVEKMSSKYCILDSNGEKKQQLRLISDLNRKSKHIYELIKSWQLLVHKKALIYRARSQARFANLK
jgi:hypothetical protein